MPKEEEDELELYLAEKEESNLSIDLLKYWKKKEHCMAGAGKNGQAIPRRACLFRWGRACVLCSAGKIDRA